MILKTVQQEKQYSVRVFLPVSKTCRKILKWKGRGKKRRRKGRERIEKGTEEVEREGERGQKMKANDDKERKGEITEK